MAEDWIALFDKLRCQSDKQGRQACLDLLLPTFSELADEYNRNISIEALMLTASRLHSPNRLMVTSSLWTLSIRTTNTAIECFLLPAAELSALMEAELPSRCKLRLVFENEEVTLDGVPLSNHELGTLLRSLLKDVIVRSQGEFDQLPDSARLVVGGQSLTGSVRSIVAEKHVLVQKIVNQQEHILAQVARDLHDAVLGNVMVLERSLSGGKQMSNSEMLLLVREASTQLREICNDLFPRDLKDCGLSPMLEELSKRLEERMSCNCSYTPKFDGELPALPDEVLLHVYRIAQECCNNIAKHSGAPTVAITLEYADGMLILDFEDDGVGIDSEPDPERAPEPESESMLSKRAGTGTSIIRERTELINCILPATLLVSSKAGQGTHVSLQIRCRPPHLLHRGRVIGAVNRLIGDLYLFSAAIPQPIE